MSKYITIAAALEIVHEADFQSIADQYLRHTYDGEFNSPGSMVVKNKTTKGRPDAFIRTKDGKYILGEYTSQDNRPKTKAAFLKKLIKDVTDCLNPKITGIPVEEIIIIVLCFNSKLDAAQQEKLRAITYAQLIELQFADIGTLTHFLNTTGKSVARDILHIAFPPLQVLSIPVFLEQYNRTGIAARLDNPLVGRERELAEIEKDLDIKNIIILKGPPGVGKSRLALEAMRKYSETHSGYISYCIVDRNASILDDLTDHIEEIINT